MSKFATAYKLDWNVAELIRMVDDKEIDFSAPIQRGYVWDDKRNSMLIQSILLGWPISVFYFNRENGKYEGLEGKQRSRAICEFVKGNYKLHAKTPPVIDKDGTSVNIARYTFNQLSEYLQNRILRYGLLVQSFDNMTIEDKIDFFTRINSGKPVTLADIARIRVKSRDVFLSLTEHPAILVGMDKINRDKYKDEDILTQLWCLCFSGQESLLQQHIGEILAVREVTEKEKKELICALDYLLELWNVVGNNKRLFSKMKKFTHILSLAYMGFLAYKKNLTKKEYVDKAIKLFSGQGRTVTISKKYNDAVGAGSSMADKVRIRMKEIEKALL